MIVTGKLKANDNRHDVPAGPVTVRSGMKLIGTLPASDKPWKSAIHANMVYFINEDHGVMQLGSDGEIRPVTVKPGFVFSEIV